MLWFKVSELMQERNYTQAQLARKMNVSPSVIAELKRGNIKKPSFELMCKIADALEVSLDEFRPRKDD